MFLAAREGHIEAVRLLLECFANRNIVDNMDRSPMMIAEERKHSAVARMLGEWNITALGHDGAVVQALAHAHAGHMANAMTSPSVVRRRQPADSFFAHQLDTPHPNMPQHPYDMYCPAGNGNVPKMYEECLNDQIPIGSSAPSTSMQPSVSIHDQLAHQGAGHHLMPPHFSPSGNATSLAVSRVDSSNSSGSPASVLSPSNTSPLTHINEPMVPSTSSYPTNTSVGQTVTAYHGDNMATEPLDSTRLVENASYPTPPSAFSGCDPTFPYSPLAPLPDSAYPTPPPDPESPERWLSSPSKGKSPNMNDLTTVIKRPMTNLPFGHGIVTLEEPPPPYRPPCPSDITYSVGGQ